MKKNNSKIQEFASQITTQNVLDDKSTLKIVGGENGHDQLRGGISTLDLVLIS